MGVVGAGTSSKEARLQQIYAQIPEIDCKGDCAEQCTSQVPMFTREAKRTGNKRTSGKWCPHLEEGRCKVHPLRPLLCRIWGVTEQMPCPHGCKPEKYLTSDETRELVQRAEKICGETLIQERKAQ